MANRDGISGFPLLKTFSSIFMYLGACRSEKMPLSHWRPGRRLLFFFPVIVPAAMNRLSALKPHLALISVASGCSSILSCFLTGQHLSDPLRGQSGCADRLRAGGPGTAALSPALSGSRAD